MWVVGHMFALVVTTTHSPSAWRWSPEPCDANDPDLEITLPALPSAGHFRRAAAVFKRCGVVTLHGALPIESVVAFRAAVEHDLAPLVASRARVVDALTNAARRRLSLRALWNDDASPLREEVLFASGRRYRERNAGRIDLQLPFKGAFSDAAFSANENVLSVLRALLGDELKLKSLHAVVALTQDDGIEEQHWHRDTQQLFIDDEQRAMDPRSARGAAAEPAGASALHFAEDVHSRASGCVSVRVTVGAGVDFLRGAPSISHPPFFTPRDHTEFQPDARRKSSRSS